MEITSAQYVAESDNQTIAATINGRLKYIPAQVGNAYYDRILVLVEEGELTIEEPE